MPGMEVFTISGSAFGADAPASASPPVLLQNAIKALGAAHGDSALDIDVDGAIGTKTVAAVNYAFKTYIGANPLKAAGLSSPQFLQAKMTKADIMRYAGTLATLVTRAVRAGGGSVPTPTVSSAKHASASVQAAANQALVADPSDTGHPNMAWFIAGGALIVVALGFMASRRRAQTA